MGAFLDEIADKILAEAAADKVGNGVHPVFVISGDADFVIEILKVDGGLPGLVFRADNGKTGAVDIGQRSLGLGGQRCHAGNDKSSQLGSLRGLFFHFFDNVAAVAGYHHQSILGEQLRGVFGGAVAEYGIGKSSVSDVSGVQDLDIKEVRAQVFCEIAGTGYIELAVKRDGGQSFGNSGKLQSLNVGV